VLVFEGYRVLTIVAVIEAVLLREYMSLA